MSNNGTVLKNMYLVPIVKDNRSDPGKFLWSSCSSVSKKRILWNTKPDTYWVENDDSDQTYGINNIVYIYDHESNN